MNDAMTTDYVVIGAGSAGSVITRRLLDAGHSVHLIEAGGRDEDPHIHSPQGWPMLMQGTSDWALTTVPQVHAGNRSIAWPRGKVLGGSGSLNGMIYIRGHRSDYDKWAAAGCEGWSWEDVLPLFKRSEDHEDGASEFHGAGGPLHVEKIVNRHASSEAFVQAANSVGISETQDFNGEQLSGAGFNHTTTKDGKRHSPWRAFMHPILGHERLTLTTDAWCTGSWWRTGAPPAWSTAPGPAHTLRGPPRRSCSAPARSDHRASCSIRASGTSPTWHRQGSTWS